MLIAMATQKQSKGKTLQRPVSGRLWDDIKKGRVTVLGGDMLIIIAIGILLQLGECANG